MTCASKVALKRSARRSGIDHREGTEGPFLDAHLDALVEITAPHRTASALAERVMWIDLADPAIGEAGVRECGPRVTHGGESADRYEQRGGRAGRASGARASGVSRHDAREEDRAEAGRGRRGLNEVGCRPTTAAASAGKRGGKGAQRPSGSAAAYSYQAPARPPRLDHPIGVAHARGLRADGLGTPPP